MAATESANAIDERLDERDIRILTATEELIASRATIGRLLIAIAPSSRSARSQHRFSHSEAL